MDAVSAIRSIFPWLARRRRVFALVGKSGTGTVVVDTAPPTTEVSTAYLIFSPDGDGNKDTLPLQQAGSKEDKWTGLIQDIAGQTVRTFTL